MLIHGWPTLPCRSHPLTNYFIKTASDRWRGRESEGKGEREGGREKGNRDWEGTRGGEMQRVTETEKGRRRQTHRHQTDR